MQICLFQHFTLSICVFIKKSMEQGQKYYRNQAHILIISFTVITYEVQFNFTEYGEFKSKHSASFFDMVRNPESSCEITLQVSSLNGNCCFYINFIRLFKIGKNQIYLCRIRLNNFILIISSLLNALILMQLSSFRIFQSYHKHQGQEQKLKKERYRDGSHSYENFLWCYNTGAINVTNNMDINAISLGNRFSSKGRTKNL